MKGREGLHRVFHRLGEGVAIDVHVATMKGRWRGEWIHTIVVMVESRGWRRRGVQEEA